MEWKRRPIWASVRTRDAYIPSLPIRENAEIYPVYSIYSLEKIKNIPVKSTSVRMKTLLIIFGFIFITNTYAQKKKDIIKEIDNYMYETIYNATYETNIDCLKTILKQYFQQDNKTNESDSEITFYIKEPFVCLIRERRDTNSNTINYKPDYFVYYKSNYFGYHRANYFGYYKTCYRDAYITVSIVDEKSKKNISVSTDFDNYTTSARTNDRKVIGIYKFDELSLRKYLYVAYYGKFVPFPERLANSINGYNSSQAKEHKKIVRSRDYYIY